VIAAKTEVETTKLTGTIYSVAEEIEAAGGKALPYYLMLEMSSKSIQLFNKQPKPLVELMC
jgi:hypothetical protein